MLCHARGSIDGLLLSRVASAVFNCQAPLPVLFALILLDDALAGLSLLAQEGTGAN